MTEAISIALNHISKILPQLRDIARYNDSMFGENATDLIGEPGPTTDEAAAYAMKRLHGQLIY